MEYGGKYLGGGRVDRLHQIAWCSCKFPDNASGERFRIGIADTASRAGCCDEQFNVLLRHAKATLTGKYDMMP
jgi:hypothetical protein